jgi:hypothetical protein
VITPQSVIWVRRMTGQARDLTEADCTAERRLDPAYRDMTLTVPDSYQGEALSVIQLDADGADVELVTQVQLIEVLRYRLATMRVKSPIARSVALSPKRARRGL